MGRRTKPSVAAAGSSGSADTICSASGLMPTSVIFARGGDSVAVGVMIGGVLETIEGYGESDAQKAGDVNRQVSVLLQQRSDSH